MAYDDTKTIDISKSSAPAANDARAALLEERARAMAEIDRRARFPEDDVANRPVVPADGIVAAGRADTELVVDVGQRNTARDSALIAIGFMLGCSITTIVVALIR